VLVKDGLWPGSGYPRIPGHELIGTIDKAAADVVQWKPGQRVGVGWNVGYCGHCDFCRRGEFFACASKANQATGITRDGGYAEYVTASATAVALAPDGISPIDAAPLMCAGVTTFNALRNAGATPGDVVAVLGLGGLGHLGVQYAAKMGFNTVGIARGKDKEELARKLGASVYIDSQNSDAAAELNRLGGAKIILATATSGEAMASVQGGMRVNGTMLVIGAAEPFPVAPLHLLMGDRSIKGWYSGTSIDSQDTLAFSHRCGVTSMNEIYPLEKANEAYARMISGKARFRVVLKVE
jgi:D-arabinose 1-dehydrogenase-like Zn-dependent alcohol dehydrogenase